MRKKTNSKHAKYSTNNPISNFLVKHFLKVAGDAYLSIVNRDRYLEAGCGEGHMSRYIISQKRPNEIFAFDIDKKEVDDASKNLPEATILAASIYEIPFESDYFDIVVCFEVLEHLEEPHKGLEELRRVSRNQLILSVPREPLWRIMNMVRFKYWNRLGNTPGHLNNWTRKQFISLVSEYFSIEKVYSPLPWTMIVCKKKY
jgi:2-polyprenyl-3-methyl-5-hydroxy-6-metoxy-1,4-benzoquinol methylase